MYFIGTRRELAVCREMGMCILKSQNYPYNFYGKIESTYKIKYSIWFFYIFTYNETCHTFHRELHEILNIFIPNMPIYSIVGLLKLSKKIFLSYFSIWHPAKSMTDPICCMPLPDEACRMPHVWKHFGLTS